MKCYVHPEVEAIAACTRCGKAACAECAVDVGGRMLCRECVASQPLLPPSRVVLSASEPRPELNVLAATSLAIALLGLIACACAGSFGGLFAGGAAIVLGVFARKQIEERPASPDSALVANMGIGLGIAEVALSLLVLLCAGSLGLLSVIMQASGRG